MKPFSGAFAKLQKATVGFVSCLSIHPHTTTRLGWIFMKPDKCFSKSVEKIQVH
jgi:hypothetical protein